MRIQKGKRIRIDIDKLVLTRDSDYAHTILINNLDTGMNISIPICNIDEVIEALTICKNEDIKLINK